MNPNGVRWGAPPLSTASVEAAIDYCDGIAALVAGTPVAQGLLQRAIDHDPSFLLPAVGLAVIRYQHGLPPDLRSTASALVSRGERQHAEVVRTAMEGDVARAGDLRREHLLEFPGDVLIVWLPIVRLVT